MEAGDWAIVLLEEALCSKLDLRNWTEIIESRERVYVTDAKSVYDYLRKDATSTSSDKRMAIEGALLRETIRRPRAQVRWIDGQQNLADILTKEKADKTVALDYLKDGVISLVQTAENQQVKEKRAKRKTRSVRTPLMQRRLEPFG